MSVLHTKLSAAQAYQRGVSGTNVHENDHDPYDNRSEHSKLRYYHNQ